MEKTGLRPIVFGPVGFFFFFLSVLGYRLLTKARRQRGSEPGNGGGSGEPAALFPTGGAGRVYYSFGGAAAQIHINTAQPGVLRDRFINTRLGAAEAGRNNKGGFAAAHRAGGTIM